jgi:pimeloyl-ACP methyl ester carboxylesterase
MAGTNRLRWATTTVDGRTVSYASGGSGPPLLFLHGWALGYRSYQPVLKHLIDSGWRVLAPGLPGLSGTADLPLEQRTLQGYAEWVAEFCAQLEVDRILVVGHSFGGGIAIKLAYDHPELVSQLVLVNSIGGSVWSDRRGIVSAMAKRPLWDWGLHLQADVLPLRQATKVLPIILKDLVPNLVRNPAGVVHVAGIARSADLEAELSALRNRRLPIVVLWGDRDLVLPQLSLHALHRASGVECVTVPGGHEWLLADPESFVEVFTNIIGLPERQEKLLSG